MRMPDVLPLTLRYSRLAIWLTAGLRRSCFRAELRKQRSLAVVATTIMRVDGKRD
jgi:hypothetical protein